MPIHIYCPTEKAIVLVGFSNEKQVLVFPSQNTRFPGIHFEAKPLVPLNGQIIASVARHCQLSEADLVWRMDIDQSFAEAVPMDSDRATLYLATIRHLNTELPRYLQTLPVLIRGMNQNRSRLAYLKAFQVLTGAREQDILAIER